LAEIHVEHRVDVALDDRIIAQQPGDRTIAVASARFGGIDRLVDAELTSGELAEHIADALEGAVALDAADESRTGDGAGVDHRIEWPVVGVEADRIERFAARLDPDGLLDALVAERVEREGKDERLGDRLDGEGRRTVSDFVDVPVDGAERSPEVLGNGARQLRNIARHLSRCVAPKPLVALLEEPLKRRHKSISGQTRSGRLVERMSIHVFAPKALQTNGLCVQAIVTSRY